MTPASAAASRPVRTSAAESVPSQDALATGARQRLVPHRGLGVRDAAEHEHAVVARDVLPFEGSQGGLDDRTPAESPAGSPAPSPAPARRDVPARRTARPQGACTVCVSRRRNSQRDRKVARVLVGAHHTFLHGLPVPGLLDALPGLPTSPATPRRPPPCRGCAPLPECVWRRSCPRGRRTRRAVPPASSADTRRSRAASRWSDR